MTPTHASTSPTTRRSRTSCASRSSRDTRRRSSRGGSPSRSTPTSHTSYAEPGFRPRPSSLGLASPASSPARWPTSRRRFRRCCRPSRITRHTARAFGPQRSVKPSIEWPGRYLGLPTRTSSGASTSSRSTSYVVRSNVFAGGAFELLRDLLVRLRRPDGPFDATVLLVAEWDDEGPTLNTVEDPAPALALPRFFADLLDAVMNSTPVDVHPEIRRRKLGGQPVGGFPPAEESVLPEP